MDGKLLAPLAALVLIAAAIPATVLALNRTDAPPSAAPERIVEPERDRLRESQRRCQQLGEAAARDAECLRVWAETRDRFLGRTPAVSPSTERR